MIRYPSPRISVLVPSVLMALFVLVAATCQVGAQDSQPSPPEATPERVTVGVRLSAPFVIAEGDGFTGLSVELWEDLASRLGLQWDYRTYDTARALVDATAAGEVDVAVTNLTVTEKRAQRVDFTQPWFDGGLRILTRTDQGSSFWDVIAGLRDSGYLRAYAWIGFVILAATLGMTIFYRRFDNDFPARWRDGLAESFYNVMVVVTSGRMAISKNLFGWVGRIFQGIWLLAGVALIAYVTSTVTSVMTALAITNQINSVDDLPGKTVGVLDGSVGEDYAEEAGLRILAFPDLDNAADALLDGTVAAIIADTAVLEYYAKTHADQPLEVVGRIFEPSKYAFATTRNDGLRRPLTIEILKAHEADEIEELRIKYFGEGS